MNIPNSQGGRFHHGQRQQQQQQQHPQYPMNQGRGGPPPARGRGPPPPPSGGFRPPQQPGRGGPPMMQPPMMMIGREGGGRGGPDPRHHNHHSRGGMIINNNNNNNGGRGGGPIINGARPPPPPPMQQQQQHGAMRLPPPPPPRRNSAPPQMLHQQQQQQQQQQLQQRGLLGQRPPPPPQFHNRGGPPPPSIMGGGRGGPLNSNNMVMQPQPPHRNAPPPPHQQHHHQQQRYPPPPQHPNLQQQPFADPRGHQLNPQFNAMQLQQQQLQQNRMRPPPAAPPPAIMRPPPMATVAAAAAAAAAPPVDPRHAARLNSAAPPHLLQQQATSATVTPVHTKAQLDQAWTVYTPASGGTTYYHNTLSKISTYEKPAALQPNEATAAIAFIANNNNNSSWKEYVDASSGKPYYSNGATTTWEKPASLVAGAGEAAQVSEPPRKKKKVAPAPETEFGSKEESVAAFKGLLLAKEISPGMKWNDVVKLCSADARWDVCANVLSAGERKQSLAEFQTKRANDLRTIERQEKARAKEAFLQLLQDSLPANSLFSAWTSRLEDVRDLLVKDDRFHTVASEATRESLFLDFCEEVKKREDRQKRSKKRQAQDAFNAFLREMEEEKLLSFASTWNSFVSSLSDEQKADVRFAATFPTMTDADRQLFFADFVIELQAVEDDKKNRIRGARRRAEKAQREAYEQALGELAVGAKILPSSRWRDVEDIVVSHASYGPVHEQDREAPREIFEDFVAEWNVAYRRDRSFLSQLVFPNNANKMLVATADTSFEEFTTALLEAAADSPDMHGQARRIINRSEPVSSAKLYLDELVEHNGQQFLNGSAVARRGRAARRGGGESSSEDEGEIVEDGEIEA